MKYPILKAVIASAVLSVCSLAQHGTAPPVKPPSPAEKPGAQPLNAGQIHTYYGVISDGQCAATGSHAEVMKKASVNSATNCVKGCARRYGYVLYNPSSRAVHKLSDQELPRDFANQRVRVKGRLDKGTNVIVVSGIEPAR